MFLDLGQISKSPIYLFLTFLLACVFVQRSGERAKGVAVIPFPFKLLFLAEARLNFYEFLIKYVRDLL